MTRLSRLPLSLMLAVCLAGAGLAGCRRAPDAAPPFATTATATAGATEAIPAVGAGTCLPLNDWLAPGQRDFRFDDNQAAIAADPSGATPYTVHFKVSLDGQAFDGDLVLADTDPSAIAIDAEDIPRSTRVCGQHAFIVDLASERGGTLAIGNLRQGKLAMTSLRYESGDEDTVQIDFKDGAIVVTDSNGSIRLREMPTPDPDLPAHGLVADYVECDRDDPGGHTWLRLDLLADGGVRALEYLSVMPGGGSCTVSANLLDGQSTLTQRNGGTDIVWSDASASSPDSRMRIERDGDEYRLDTAGVHAPAFCGQTAQLADSVALKRGQAQCAKVQWPAR